MMKRIACLAAAVAAVSALAQSEGFPQAPATSPLSRQDLLQCVELEDGLTARRKAHESHVTQLSTESQALEAEAASIEERRQLSVSSDKVAAEALSARIQAYNRRAQTHRAAIENLRADESDIAGELSRFNDRCANRPYSEPDMQWARQEYRNRQSAAASAPAFDAGVQAFQQGKYQEALALWLPLAERGSVSAQFNIAAMYDQGVGVTRSETEAARWYVMAARAGHVPSQLKVATLYEAGVGVTKDLSTASYWYGEAKRGVDKDPRSAHEAEERLGKLPSQYQGGSEELIAFEGGRYVLRRSPDKDCVVALQGTVTPSAEVEFEHLLRKASALGCNKPLNLLLESPGGRHDTGISLAKSVRYEQMRTIVRFNCASSCATIFLAGTERVMWGSKAAVGFHQISRVRGSEGTEAGTCVASNFDPSTVALRRYLQFAVPETSEQIFAIAMKTPCDKIEWVKGQRALELQVATKVEAEGEDVFGSLQERMDAITRTR